MNIKKTIQEQQVKQEVTDNDRKYQNSIIPRELIPKENGKTEVHIQHQEKKNY